LTVARGVKSGLSVWLPGAGCKKKHNKKRCFCFHGSHTRPNCASWKGWRARRQPG